MDLPDNLREASHRVLNESQMIRSEVVVAAGGPAAYERKAAELRSTMDKLMRRIQ